MLHSWLCVSDPPSWLCVDLTHAGEARVPCMRVRIISEADILSHIHTQADSGICFLLAHRGRQWTHRELCTATRGLEAG